MKFNLLINSIDETLSLGESLVKILKKGSIITLTGDLGVGKTTFVKGFGKGLNIKEEINSPSFNILKCYFNNDGLNLYHIDAYRLEGLDYDNKNVGLDEVIYGDGICVIEWPMFINEFYSNSDSLNILIERIDECKRKFTFESDNELYKDVFTFLEGNK